MVENSTERRDEKRSMALALAHIHRMHGAEYLFVVFLAFFYEFLIYPFHIFSLGVEIYVNLIMTPIQSSLTQ